MAARKRRKLRSRSSSAALIHSWTNGSQFVLLLPEVASRILSRHAGQTKQQSRHEAGAVDPPGAVDDDAALRRGDGLERVRESLRIEVEVREVHETAALDVIGDALEQVPVGVVSLVAVAEERHVHDLHAAVVLGFAFAGPTKIDDPPYWVGTERIPAGV